MDANVFNPSGSLRYPAMLLRTPYGKGGDLPPGYASFLNHGYAVMIQDVRGRYDSEGVFDSLRQEGPDGYDTLNWIAAQALVERQGGDDRRVVFGHRAVAGGAARTIRISKPSFRWSLASDDYFDRYYSRGGAMRLGHRLMWLSENLNFAGNGHAEVQRLHRAPAAADFRPRGGAPDAGTFSNRPESSDLRFVLEAAERAGEDRASTRAGFRGGRMVRQLSWKAIWRRFRRCTERAAGRIRSTGS